MVLWIALLPKTHTQLISLEERDSLYPRRRKLLPCHFLFCTITIRNAAMPFCTISNQKQNACHIDTYHVGFYWPYAMEIGKWTWVKNKCFQCREFAPICRDPYVHNGTKGTLTLKVLNFWKFTSYYKTLMGRTSPTLHPPSPSTVHQLSRLAL